MSEKKKTRQVNPRTFSFFVGVAICLLSVILIMNVGYPARAFAFLPFYLLGIGSYAFYLFLYAVGLSYLFRGKGLGFKLNNKFLGVFLLVIAGLMMTTLISCSSDLPGKEFLKQYNDLLFTKTGDGTSFAERGGYWNIQFINMFGHYHFGGGLIGYALTGLLNGSIGKGGTWAITIVIIVLSLVIFFIKEIIQIIKKISNKNRVEKVRNEAKKNEEKQPHINSYPSFVPNEREIIRGASQIDNSYSNEVRSPYPQPIESQTVVSNFNNRSNYVASNDPNASFSGDTFFKPAYFVRRSDNPSPITSSNVPPKPVVEEPRLVTGEEALLEDNQEITRSEQLTLDFNAKPEINQELVTAKPEFIEPVSVSKPQPAPEVVQEAIMQEPVVKPKIKWIPPSVALLEDLQTTEAAERNNAVAQERLELINQTFESFGVGASCVDFVVGPSVTNFRIQYENNVSVKNVANLVQDISRNLGGIPARFQSIVEGSRYSGIEVSNAVITPVSFKEVYEQLPDVKKKPLAMAFGKKIDGSIYTANIADFPHALVSGTTGSGKSVFIQSIICSLIMRNSPDDLRLVLVDPKQVEMAAYRDIPHLLCPVISDMKKAKVLIDKLVKEMNDRYSLFEENLCRSITEYNELAEEEGKEKIPYIVMFIDEYADLIQTYKEVGVPVVQIAQKARAAGIHMFIATQRPSTDVISGVIKGNLPTRVALKVANQVDSVTILGEGGAEKLLGKGDMLVFLPGNSSEPMRVQSCFIQNKEIRHIIGYLKEHYPVNYDPRFLNLEEEAEQSGKVFVNSPAFDYNSEDDEEAKYKSIKEWVMTQKYMSMSRIQRDCSVGFNRAGRMFKRLQDEGIIATEVEGNKGCPVLVNEEPLEENVVTSEELTR